MSEDKFISKLYLRLSWKWIGRCIALLLYAAILVSLVIRLGHSNYIMLSILMPVEGALLWYVLGGKFFSVPCLMEIQTTQLKRVIILHVSYFIITILLAIYFINASLDCQKWMWFVKRSSEYGTYLKDILLVMMVLFAIIYVINIIFVKKYSIEWYSLALHAMGSIWMIFAFQHMFLMVTDPRLIIPMFIKGMLIYAEGVILALVFLYYSHKLISKGGK